MTEATLYHDEHWTIFHDREQAFVRVVRSSVPFTDPTQVAATFHELERIVREHALVRGKLLIDSRDAIGRNDPEFEGLANRFRTEVLGGFAASAVLVKSAVGRMQVERMSRERGGIAPTVFTDEAEAYRALGIAR